MINVSFVRLLVVNLWLATAGICEVREFDAGPARNQSQIENKSSNYEQMSNNAGQARTNVLSWTDAEPWLFRPYFANAMLCVRG